jgi:hypothetical protein
MARIQDAGLANLTAAWVAYASLPKYLQWGTGTGAAKSANVVTTTTTTEARTLARPRSRPARVTNDKYQVIGTITAAGARAITEVGVFDAAGAASPPVGGNMDIYGDFAVINLASGDSIAFTVGVTFS